MAIHLSLGKVKKMLFPHPCLTTLLITVYIHYPLTCWVFLYTTLHIRGNQLLAFQHLRA